MCTGIKLMSKEGNVFWGRTMDLNSSMFGEGADLPTSFVSLPTGVEIKAQSSTWISKCATMGVGLEGTQVVYDGINEFGLAGDLQVLMESTRKKESEFAGTNLEPIIAEEFVSFILTNFKSVAEIRENYSKYAIVDKSFMFRGNPLVFPVHYSFIDSTGDAIVLEPVDNGEFKLYDFMGVMTNSPEYFYHTTNIRNYIGLDTLGEKEKTFSKENYSLNPIEGGTGYGFWGMPGDYTSPSRFVRSFYISQNMEEFDSSDGINELYTSFRPVYIPEGLERSTSDDPTTDFTRYWSGYDFENLEVYVQTGKGLVFSKKQLDKSITEVTYDTIEIGNY